MGYGKIGKTFNRLLTNTELRSFGLVEKELSIRQNISESSITVPVRNFSRNAVLIVRKTGNGFKTGRIAVG